LAVGVVGKSKQPLDQFLIFFGGERLKVCSEKHLKIETSRLEQPFLKAFVGLSIKVPF
jgi:hypothetical protein